jgi:hypothetical protein
MFIFTINHDSLARELMDCIMGYDNSLILKEFLNQLNNSISTYVYSYNRSKIMSI